MKRLISVMLFFLALLTITACGNDQNKQQSNKQTESTTVSSIQEDSQLEGSKQSEAASEQLVTDLEVELNGGTQSEVQMSEKHIVITTEQGNEIIFLLNDTPAANSFYDQLPLTVKVENYGSNEKIFYPPEKLDTTNGIHNSGILNYYAPWGDIFMPYGPRPEDGTAAVWTCEIFFSPVWGVLCCAAGAGAAFLTGHELLAALLPAALFAFPADLFSGPEAGVLALVLAGLLAYHRRADLAGMIEGEDNEDSTDDSV